MDFNLMDTFFHDTKKNVKTIAHPHKIPRLAEGYYQESPESSDFEFSGGSPALHFMTSPPPFHNAYTCDTTNPNLPGTTKFPLFLPNMETVNELSVLQKTDSLGVMREMIFRMAMMQPVQIDPESVKAPKRKNVRISKDPQSVAARHRRERISERIRILQRMVPGGTKLDTASMLDEAVHYLKFLKKQLHSLEQAAKCNYGPMFPTLGSMQMF